MADLLSIGKTGLNASKKSLETTSHNIANVNTEGFSRQKTVQTTNVPISKSGLIQGTGARVTGVTRSHDQFVEKRLNQSTTSHNFFKERAEQLEQVENIFSEVNGDGLNKVLNKFYNSFRELANQPENETIRSVVRDSAEMVAQDFKRIRGSLDNMARQVDGRLEREVEDINQAANSISELNKKIASLEGLGGETGDLRDQRDLLVRQLSESFAIHTYVDEKNNYIVMAKNVGTLVSGGEVQELAIRGTAKDDSSNNMAGSVEVYFKNRPSAALTERFKGGRLSSMAQVRNQDIQGLQKKIDDIAYDFANSVNAIHRRGHVNREIPPGALADSKGPVTGLDFFAVPLQRENASLHLDLSEAVKSDLSNISTALEANSPGDNRIALAISKLQHERIMDNGTATLEESYLQTIGRIGLETGKAKLDREQSEGILVQARSIRERIAGVNLDEETANMVRYQHAYQASAKVMQAAQEMFETVLAIKR